MYIELEEPNKRTRKLRKTKSRRMYKDSSVENKDEFSQAQGRANLERQTIILDDLQKNFRTY